jgi:pimeloyl-ACP methyl ester carboxylesterase
VIERDVRRGDRTLRVREAGAPSSSTVIYFHGTPGSRLDMAFADQLAADLGVKVVSFDRPGYGGSTPARFSLSSVALDAAAVADALGIGEFATLGQSGGGPFSLASAAVLDGRVTRAGVASGGGPFELVPGAMAALDEGDRAALALLPDDPTGAAAAFAAGFEGFAEMFAKSTPLEVASGFGPMLSARDRQILLETELAVAIGTSMKESLQQGCSGGGWDNVSWVGPWDVDPTTIDCPVLLWYGDEDRFCSPAHGVWLRQNLRHATLTLRAGEGHLGFIEHTAEMLSSLTA